MINRRRRQPRRPDNRVGSRISQGMPASTFSNQALQVLGLARRLGALRFNRIHLPYLNTSIDQSGTH